GRGPGPGRGRGRGRAPYSPFSAFHSQRGGFVGGWAAYISATASMAASRIVVVVTAMLRISVRTMGWGPRAGIVTAHGGCNRAIGRCKIRLKGSVMSDFRLGGTGMAVVCRVMSQHWLSLREA